MSVSELGCAKEDLGWSVCEGGEWDGPLPWGGEGWGGEGRAEMMGGGGGVGTSGKLRKQRYVSYGQF